jgi:hypothetical protein
MLHVLLPDNNHHERRYATATILEDFLGLSTSIAFGPTLYSLEITLPNGKRLCFSDHFFQQFPEPGSYLSHQNLPQKIVFARKDQNPFLTENDLPIIFGDASIQVAENQITCGADILASTFFMLTRWEEYVNPVRDHHQRFPGHAAVAVQNNFIHRPVVNEYVEMLWGMLKYLGIHQQRKTRKFRAIITHDVDSPILWRSPFTFIKKIGGDIFKRNSLKEAVNSTGSYANYLIGKKKDPYDVFDELMESSENNNLQSHFYFLCGGQHKEDIGLPLSHPFTKKLLNKINDRGHVIGFHPSYTSYNNKEIFNKELHTLRSASPQPIIYGRQHFLKFEVPITWQLWDNTGLQFDSTMYYADMPGFRCGTCYDFPVFDIIKRKQLNLREMPLTAMEVTWTVYKNSSPEEMQVELLALKNTCKKYNGTFVLLWHNSSFNTRLYRPYKPVYEEIIKTLQAELS